MTTDESMFVRGALLKRVLDPVKVHAPETNAVVEIVPGDIVLVIEVLDTNFESVICELAYDLLVLHYGSSTGMGTIRKTIGDYWVRIC